MTLAGAAGVALLPTLLTYSPLLLIALSPLGRHLVLAAPSTAMLPFVVVATLRRLLTCILAYYFGQAYGTSGITWVVTRYPRLTGFVRGLEWLFDRAAPLVVFVAPGPIICAMAGATRMRLWLFVPIAAAGQVVWTSLTYRLGEALSAWIKPIMAFFQEHMISTTVGFVLLMLAYRLLRRNSPAENALAGLATATADDNPPELAPSPPALPKES